MTTIGKVRAVLRERGATHAGASTASANKAHVARRRKTGARKAHEPELVGAMEAAQILGVSQTNLRVLRGLPEPYQVIRATTLWRADDIHELADQRAAARGRSDEP